MNAQPTTLLEHILKGKWIGKGFLLLVGLVVVWWVGGKALQSPSLFLQQIINGIQLGFVYALIALGYTMVYGIVRLINFAHGDVFMFGAFVSYFSVGLFQLHLWPVRVFPGLSPTAAIILGTVSVILLSMVSCAILAITIERIAYKPLRDAPRISALITAIGVSFF
ncbi:MAG: branched-chain amino acid ABC transporter permease, partial [Anaerolineales bacterium]|nr:branched-chain amino acid ABC transporter permease [Anaerolineales bacterium]MDW8446100.1 branched-chain amino acid ABC transporter permease [Anaerolineales bacterium]